MENGSALDLFGVRDHGVALWRGAVQLSYELPANRTPRGSSLPCALPAPLQERALCTASSAYNPDQGSPRGTLITTNYSEGDLER